MGWFRRSGAENRERGEKAGNSPNELAKTFAAAAAGDPNTSELLLAETMAAAGRPEAMHDLGVTYQQQNNWPKAIECYRAAAEKGLAASQVNLGMCYAEGLGVPRDSAEAVRWFRKAADQGDSGGCFKLGIMYANGWGLPQDYDKAYAWVDKAAKQGNQEALAARNAVAQRAILARRNR